MSMALIAKSQINVLGLNNLSLLCLLMENGIVQRFSLIENFDIVFSIQAHSHGCMLQGISWAFGLDLINSVSKLKGQVLG